MQEVKRYPQVPGFSEEELAAFLAQPLLARLSTLNADGTIHTGTKSKSRPPTSFLLTTPKAL